tara:strand:- start:204 stop:1538 length:1335 start_codon:yes stop_codon:yes gene_type:complete
MTKNLVPPVFSKHSSDQDEKEQIDKSSPLQKFLDAAENGDGESQYILGCMFLDGTGPIPFSKVLAEKWLLKAYRHGVIDSLWDIAYMIGKGYELQDESFEIKSEKDCYKAIIENDLSSELSKEKAQKKLDKLNEIGIPPVFTNNAFKKTKNLSNNKQTQEPSQKPVVTKNIDDFIGLEKIKKQIKILENLAVFNTSRQKVGLKTQDNSNHLVFTGNPGTGKTEIARIMGSIYQKAGILEHGHVIEVDRSGLVGEYIGQTAVKTLNVISRAHGGVLFIDEAHAICNHSSERDFGHECLSTLVKAMEDSKDNFIVIMAGYPKQMDWLLRANPGLNSRIKHHFYFDDYTEQELVDIYLSFTKDNDYIVHKDAKPAIQALMKKAIKFLNHDFGNGRYARNCFEKTIEKMAYRVAGQKSHTKKTLKTIMFMDIPTFEELAPGKERKGII